MLDNDEKCPNPNVMLLGFVQTSGHIQIYSIDNKKNTEKSNKWDSTLF